MGIRQSFRIAYRNREKDPCVGLVKTSGDVVNNPGHDRDLIV